MAKIGDLVKTYRLLSDPKAPDWNIKFAGAVIITLTLVAGAAALLWTIQHDATSATTGAAAVQEAPGASMDDCAPVDAQAPTPPSAVPVPCAESTVLP